MSDYINDADFSALFTDPLANHEPICLSLALIAREVARQFRTPNRDDRLERVQQATLDCIRAVPTYSAASGSALRFFSVVALNTYRLALRRALFKHNRPYTNLELEQAAEGKSYYTLSELMPHADAHEARLGQRHRH